MEIIDRCQKCNLQQIKINFEIKIQTRIFPSSRFRLEMPTVRYVVKNILYAMEL